MTMMAWLMMAQAAASIPAPAAAVPATPAAAGATQQGDERCLVAFGELTSRGGPSAQAGRLGTMFFYGRLMGRDPALDLAAALPAAARAIAGQTQAELTRCGRELEQAGHALAAAGSAAR